MKTSKTLSILALLLVSFSFFGFVKETKVVDPVATIDGINSGGLTKDRLQAVNAVKVETKTKDGKVIIYKVTRYSFAIAPLKSTDNGPVSRMAILEINGNMITTDAKDKLKLVVPGDIIVIANVHCIGPDGTELIFSGSTYTVVAS